MLDLYIVITPIFGLLAVWTLVNFKYTLNEPKLKDLSKYQKKLSQNNHENSAKTQTKDSSLQPGFKKTFFYFIKNFTLAEFCLVRRNRNKIPFLLSISSIALLSVLIDIDYAFCFIGIAVTFTFVLSKMLTNEEEDETEESQTMTKVLKAKQQDRFQQKLQVIMTSLSLLINMVLISTVYKNYQNALLLAAAQNFLITIALDNVLVKPLVFAIVSFSIKNTHFVDVYIDKEIKIIQILQEQRVYKKVSDAHISAISPRKRRSSPSKVPKAMQKQPRINLQNKQNYLSSLQLTKSIRKSKLSPITLKKRIQSNQQGESSLISILNSQQKKKHSSNRNLSYDFNQSQFQQKCHQQQPIPQHSLQQSKFSFQSRKRNKLYSSKLILINQDQSIIHDLNDDKDIENQQEEDAKANGNNKSTLKEKSLKDSDYKSRNCDGLKVSLNKSIEEENQDRGNRANFDNYFQDEEIQGDYHGRPNSTLEEDNSIIGSNAGGGVHTSRKNGLLKINQDRNAEDLEEIDLNSPERRKQQLSKIVEDADKPKKKKGYKKYSLDPNRHVIKHSTGEPYLEFLPNLLNKQRDQKKRKSVQQSSQQVFSRKIDIMNGFVNESRLIKSVKRPKNNKDPIVRQNDENRIPQFIVQDFN